MRQVYGDGGGSHAPFGPDDADEASSSVGLSHTRLKQPLSKSLQRPLNLLLNDRLRKELLRAHAHGLYQQVRIRFAGGQEEIADGAAF